MVSAPPEELHALLEGIEMLCPTALCRGVLARVSQFFTTAKPIPLQTFFRAVQGFGSATGEAATLKRFSHLLKTKKITQIYAEPVGKPERVILRTLVLDDGTRLHFDSSARGACCYYIEEAGPTCLEVVDHELRRIEDVGSGGPAGEESRRAPQNGDRGTAGESASPPAYHAPFKS